MREIMEVGKSRHFSGNVYANFFSPNMNLPVAIENKIANKILPDFEELAVLMAVQRNRQSK